MINRPVSDGKLHFLHAPLSIYAEPHAAIAPCMQLRALSDVFQHLRELQSAAYEQLA